MGAAARASARGWRWAGWLALGVCLAPAARAGVESQCIKNLVCMDFAHNDDHATISVRNKLRVPVGVQIRFQQLQNVTPVPRLLTPNVAERVVEPQADTLLLTLVRENARLPAAFPFNWRFSYGNPTARHDDTYSYRIPFGGSEPRTLTQGANGRFTHKGPAAWSFDFEMPVGTPILAARGGRVVEKTDGYTKSGISEEFLDRANAITVLHDDGTFGTYAHLDPGVGVREGMRMSVGELLGFSGDTGFSTGPHLHFSVWSASWTGGKTLPIRFYDGTASGFLPQEGRAYEPGCHEGGRICRPGERPAAPASAAEPGSFSRTGDGSCRCRNGAIITTKLPCRAVCP